MRQVFIALAVGTVVTLAFLGLAVAADQADQPGIAYALFWQNGLLQQLVPLHNVGTPANPVHMGTPLNVVAFFASIPLGIVIYSGLAYTALDCFRRVR